MRDMFIIIVTLHYPDWPDGCKTWCESLWAIVGTFGRQRRAEKHLIERHFERCRDGSWSMHPNGDEAYYEAKIVEFGSGHERLTLQRTLGPKDSFDPNPIW
jgi:hypothetical protein